MAQEKNRSNVLFQLEGKSHDAATQLDILARDYYQKHPYKYPLNGDELLVLSQQAKREILATAREEMPDALAALGLDQPVVQITTVGGGLPRAYADWPGTFADEGKTVRYFMYSPVDYKGDFFVPEDAINISDKGETAEAAVGELLFAGGWLGNAPILDIPRQGVALPPDYDPQTSHVVHRGGASDENETIRVFRAGGESLAAVEDFLFREYAQSRATTALFDFIKDMTPRRLPRERGEKEKINPSLSFGAGANGAAPSLRLSLRYSSDGEGVPLHLYPAQDAYKFVDIANRRALLSVLKDELPQKLPRRLEDGTEGEPEDVYPDFEVGTAADGRPEVTLFMRFRRDGERFVSDTMADSSRLEHLRVPAKNTAFTDIRRGHVPDALPRRRADGTDGPAEDVRASLGMTPQEDGTIESRLLLHYARDGAPVPDDLYPPPDKRYLTEMIAVEFRLAPNDDTKAGQEFSALLKQAAEPRPQLIDYTAIANGPGAQHCHLDWRALSLSATAQADIVLPPSVSLHSFEGDHFLTYRLPEGGQGSDDIPDGGLPVSSQALEWLAHDKDDRSMGISPPPPPDALAAELAALNEIRPGPFDGAPGRRSYDPELQSVAKTLVSLFEGAAKTVLTLTEANAPLQESKPPVSERNWWTTDECLNVLSHFSAVARLGGAWSLAKFYRGETANVDGRKIDEVLEKTGLDDIGGDIQSLFPLPERSRFRDDVPLLTKGDRDAFTADAGLRDALRGAYRHMLALYGFEEKNSDVVKAGDFSARADEWLMPDSGNFLRITRMLKSIRLLGLEDEAKAFLGALENIAADPDYRDIVSPSLEFWRKAASPDGPSGPPAPSPSP